MGVCGRGVLALFSMKLVTLGAETLFLTDTYVFTRIYLYVLSSEYNISHMSMLGIDASYSTPYDISEVVARSKLSLHFYAVMHKIRACKFQLVISETGY